MADLIRAAGLSVSLGGVKAANGADNKSANRNSREFIGGINPCL
jgi:hypothetical protein